MSQEAVREFLEQVQKTPSLQSEVKNALSQTGANWATLTALADQHGFSVSVADFQAVATERIAQTPAGNGELSEGQLNAVAGGGLTESKLSIVMGGNCWLPGA